MTSWLPPLETILPRDADRAALVGRAQTPDGPSVVTVRGGKLVDITRDFPTVSALAEHAEDCGLRPVLAHPERADAVQAEPDVVQAYSERWPVHVNGSSLTGYHGTVPCELGWSFLERGLATLVASDGHRPARPPFLDEAWDAARARLGGHADCLFDG